MWLRSFGLGMVIAVTVACGTGKPTNDDERAAEATARSRLAQFVTECNGDYFGAWPGDSFSPAGVYQYHGVTVSVRARRPSEADKANGVDWAGAVEFEPKIYRRYDEAAKAWGQWADASSASIFRLIVTRTRGAWGSSTEDRHTPISCASVPRE